MRIGRTVLEVYLVGSRMTGRATADSDYDLILLVQGGGALSLSDFETIPSDEKAWGWLLSDDASRLCFAPDAHCDIMLVHASSEEFRADGSFAFAGPHALLWRRHSFVD